MATRLPASMPWDASLVGPESAEAEPRPRLPRGRGGIHPTVTDADLILGRRIDPGAVRRRSPAPLDSAKAAAALQAGYRTGPRPLQDARRLWRG